MAQDETDDARLLVRPSDRRYPSNARRTRPLVWAIAVPVLVVLVLAGVFVYQRVHGARSVDPLTLNAKARDAVILLPVPDGWTRTDVVTTCPGEPAGCAGGGFRTVGTTSTRWLTPEVGGAVTRAEAVNTACQDLAAQLSARSSAPPVEVASCVASLGSRSTKAEPVLAWAGKDGDWVVSTVPRADLPTDADPKRFGLTVAFTPRA